MYLKINEIINKHKTINENFKFDDSKIIYKEGNKYDIFLSYNHGDIELAQSIYHELIRQKLSVYVDFIDPTYSNIVNETTAAKLATKISNCKVLIYVHTKNAAKSKWCPWEIGLASGLKNFKCIILPAIENNDGEFVRQEYLLLYPYLTYNHAEGKSDMYFWVHENETLKSIELKCWIDR